MLWGEPLKDRARFMDRVRQEAALSGRNATFSLSTRPVEAEVHDTCLWTSLAVATALKGTRRPSSARPKRSRRRSNTRPLLSNEVNSWVTGINSNIEGKADPHHRPLQRQRPPHIARVATRWRRTDTASSRWPNTLSSYIKSSFPRERESRGRRFVTCPWTSAFAAVTRKGAIGLE